MLKSRRTRLDPFFEEHSLDAILLTKLPVIRYLSGFTGSDGALLISREGGCWFLCDSRYTEQARLEVRDAEICTYVIRQEGIASLIDDRKFSAVGIEATHMTVAEFNGLSGAVKNCRLQPLGSDFSQIRATKDETEIDRLEQVARLASESLRVILPALRPGVSEAHVSRELEFEMRRRGADARAFDFIVASGDRGALPHGRASERVIRAGDLVTIDFGAVRDGYHSDETVTVAFGSPDRRLREIHEVVKSAHDRAIDAVRPGMSCRELDAVARNYISTRGYGDFFGHGLGHGVGLEIHEKPVISPRSEAILEPGMVFTVEPGVYIPGQGGVRIEDMVAVTSDGCRVLTSVPKELMML